MKIKPDKHLFTSFLIFFSGLLVAQLKPGNPSDPGNKYVPALNSALSGGGSGSAKSRSTGGSQNARKQNNYFITNKTWKKQNV